MYFPITKETPQYNDYIKWKNNLFGGRKAEFVLFFNSRNIRRKQIPDAMLAFRHFLDSLPKEKAKNCYFILHTEHVTDAGTDLPKVKEYLFDEEYEHNVQFSTNKLPQEHLNFLYNVADVQILLTSNEGWGLTITEAMFAGTPIIANVTGGMQDQMRFVDNKGKWFTPCANVPSNHRGTYKEHGEWAFPVYPTSRSVQGSPPTPYIYDDRCTWEDASDRIMECYNLGRKELKRRGLKGREWAMSDEAGFTAEVQAKTIINSIEKLFSTWKPREKYEIVNATKYKGRFLKHKVIY